MTPQDLADLLAGRGVDERLRSSLVQIARSRNVDPATTDTRQLLLSVEPDGTAAVNVLKASMRLQLKPEDARRARALHDLPVEERNPTTWIVTVHAGYLDSSEGRESALALLGKAFDHADERGPWNRGLPDRTRQQGELCTQHHVQMSVTGECPMCDA